MALLNFGNMFDESEFNPNNFNLNKRQKRALDTLENKLKKYGETLPVNQAGLFRVLHGEHSLMQSNPLWQNKYDLPKSVFTAFDGNVKNYVSKKEGLIRSINSKVDEYSKAEGMQRLAGEPKNGQAGSRTNQAFSILERQLQSTAYGKMGVEGIEFTHDEYELARNRNKTSRRIFKEAEEVWRANGGKGNFIDAMIQENKRIATDKFLTQNSTSQAKEKVPIVSVSSTEETASPDKTIKSVDPDSAEYKATVGQRARIEVMKKQAKEKVPTVSVSSIKEKIEEIYNDLEEMRTQQGREAHDPEIQARRRNMNKLAKAACEGKAGEVAVEITRTSSKSSGGSNLETKGKVGKWGRSAIGLGVMLAGGAAITNLMMGSNKGRLNNSQMYGQQPYTQY